MVQAAASIKNKIYYIGGTTDQSNFLYLEMDKGWVDLTSQGVNLPLKAGHIADIGRRHQSRFNIY